MSIESYSEKEIIDRILGRDVGLFEILIRRNNPFLYKMGRSYGYGHEDTQDLMQDTFIDAYSGLSKFQGRASFQTWIARIMLNNCHRKRKMHGGKGEPTVSRIRDDCKPMFSDDHYSDTGKSVIKNEMRHVIEQAMQRIPLDYRMVFSLREIGGLNIAETAEALGITPVNVKVRLNRAKSLLRKEVERFYSLDDMYEFNLVYCDGIVKKVIWKINEK